MQNLFSCSSVLEGLTVEGTLDHDHDSSLDISVPELKTLIFRLRHHSKILTVSVIAPKIINLHLRKLGSTNVVLIGGVDLVNASLCLLEYNQIQKDLDVSSFAVTILNQVCNARSLSLLLSSWQDLHLTKDLCLPIFHNMENFKMNYFWDKRCWNLVAAIVKNAPNLNNHVAKIMTSPKDAHLPALRHLKRLELDFWDHGSWGLLPVFLNSSPNLEELIIIDRCRGSKTPSEENWNPPKDVPSCLKSLQTVTFKGHKSWQYQKQIICYLQENGHLQCYIFP